MIRGEFKGHDGERRGRKVSLQVHVRRAPGPTRGISEGCFQVWVFSPGGGERCLREDRGEEMGSGFSASERPGEIPEM